MNRPSNPYEQTDCPECFGYSKWGYVDCDRCENSGYVLTESALQARLEGGERDLDRLLNPPDERIAELRAMPYQDYLWTLEWRERRAMHIRMADYTCDRCGIRTRRYGALQVHHKTYEHLGREERNDLEVLCRDCHRVHHGITE